MKDLVITRVDKSIPYYIGSCNINFSKHITNTLKSSYLSYEGSLGFEKSAYFKMDNGIEVIMTTIDTYPKYKIIDGIKNPDTTISVFSGTISNEMIDNKYYHSDMAKDIVKALKLDNVSILENNISLEEYLLLKRSHGANETIEEINLLSVSRKLALRYIAILKPIENIDRHLDKMANKNLIWMCNQIIEENYPIDKVSRWIGFIQGVMACKGYILINEERDFSRPLFHQAYRNGNIEIPKTLELNMKSNENY